jgi:excisionase family DNA binding protein
MTRQGHGDGALTIPQVCQQLNVTRHTVYGLIERGELAAFVIGNRYRVEPHELQRYKERHRVAARPREHMKPEQGHAVMPAAVERCGADDNDA